MALVKKWEVKQTNVISNLFGLQNVVRSIDFLLTLEVTPDSTPGGTLGVTTPATFEQPGSVNLPLPYDTNSFVPFENLTKEQLENWLFTTLGPMKAEHERNIENTFALTLINQNPDTMQLVRMPVSWDPTAPIMTL